MNTILRPLLITLLFSVAAFGQQTGIIGGQCQDTLGAVVVGASMTVLSADAKVLKEKDLEALTDDPDELEAALQALAGPSSGPNGGQIYIDGFTGGRLPPKEAIREIRINQNPFSAEYDRLGFGRIEILTK